MLMIVSVQKSNNGNCEVFEANYIAKWLCNSRNCGQNNIRTYISGSLWQFLKLVIVHVFVSSSKSGLYMHVCVCTCTANRQSLLLSVMLAELWVRSSHSLRTCLYILNTHTQMHGKGKPQ